MSKARSKARKMLLTVLVIGVVGALAGIGTFSAFSDTTDSSGNLFAAGTVTIVDNDSGSALYNVSGLGGGDTVEECITLTYQGDLAADVRLYDTTGVNAFGQYVDMTVEKMTGAGVFGDCTGFSADPGGPLYSGDLLDFASTYDGWANGLGHYPDGQAQWNQNDEVTYRFTLTLQDVNAAQGGTSGLHDFVWEAQNQ